MLKLPVNSFAWRVVSPVNSGCFVLINFRSQTKQKVHQFGILDVLNRADRQDRVEPSGEINLGGIGASQVTSFTLRERFDSFVTDPLGGDGNEFSTALVTNLKRPVRNTPWPSQACR